MSMRKREEGKQAELWLPSTELARSPGHHFYDQLNKLLAEVEFDVFVEGLCKPFYKDGGRPGIAPGVYFRMLLIGYFEGIDSERGIAWRCCDSLSLRAFLGFTLTESTPDHSSLSRIRQRLSAKVHEDVFEFVLKVLSDRELLPAESIGIDGTTLEANAALRSIVRRDSGANYEEFLTELAKKAGIENPSREDLARLDRKRPKKGSNADWKHPHDPDAQIAKMKNGSTHMAHKSEHAVDMDSGAIMAVTLHGGVAADTHTIYETMKAVCEKSVVLGRKLLPAWVADKGYHSNETMRVAEELGLRTYIAEPKRGRRKWKDKEAAKNGTYANRRRVRSERGKKLMRKRGELVERSFAHCLETGGLRRTWLRGHENIRKRYIVHIAGFNLGLVMRKMLGVGTPRGLAGLKGFVDRIKALFERLDRWLEALCAKMRELFGSKMIYRDEIPVISQGCQMRRFSTGC